ncbi:MAG: VWA domain-containing protein [Pyrinomonadaceae bacterium]
MKFRVLLTIVFIAIAPTSFAQSARVKKTPEKETEKPKKEGSYLPTQVVTKTPVPIPEVSATPTPTANTDDDVINVESALVPIPVSVVDNASGRAVTNLTIDDFRLMIDNKEVEIGEVFRAESPVRLALLFDNSSSVTIAREFEQKAAIQFFKRVIRPDKDLAALYSVAGVSKLEQPLTKDVSALIQAIKLFEKPQGATALHDGIIEASNYLQDHAGRRVIVIVSDGQDTLSDATFDQMVKTVQENNCQIYIVHTNEFENYKRTGSRAGSANLRALAAERRMKTLAEQTGGAVYSPIDEKELDDAFTKISVELAQQYILGYYPIDEIRDGKMRVIDLNIKTDKSLTIRSRKGYYVSRPN